MATKLLRLPEVKDRTGLSLHTLRRWASQRRIPTVRIGRAVFVPERDLDRLIEARKEPARTDVAV